VLLNSVYFNLIKTCLHVSEIKKNKKLKFIYVEVYFKQGKGGLKSYTGWWKIILVQGFADYAV
jgi:hypothetical protein